MKNSKFLIKFWVLALIIHFMLAPNNKAQIPVNDPAWIKDTALSDDFGGTSLKTYKWYAWDSGYQHGLGLLFNRPYHKDIVISGGTLKIKADTLDPNRTYSGTTYHYQGGQIDSKSPSFKYGYLEISAKYPIGNVFYWPGFWVWGQGSCTPGDEWYSEIDIAENQDSGSFNGHLYDTNLYSSDPGSCSGGITHLAFITGLPRLDSIFHKYAVQWDYDKVTFYFDDLPVRSVPNSVVPTSHYSLTLILDFYIIPWVHKLLHMPAATYEIDYFNYYKLNTDCDNALTISNPGTDYYKATSPRAIKKSITTETVGGASPTFNLSDSCTLRATDYILLGAGTTINGNGTGQFSAIITPCPK